MQSDRELNQIPNPMIDRIIDTALPGYSQAEPRPGLEQRILARSLAEPPPRKRLVWAWALAIPSIVCALLLLLLLGRHHPDEPIREARIQAIPAGAPTTQALPAQPSSNAVRTKRRTRMLGAQTISPPPPLPKQEVFPTPSPLTPEERAIVALSNLPVQMPKQLEDLAGDIDPIHIAELQIKPLTVKVLDISDSALSNPKSTQP